MGKPTLPPIPHPGCVSPLQAWQPKPGTDSLRAIYRAPEGNALRYFNGEPLPEHRPFFEPIEVPCGKCMPCRLSHSMEWAARISAEARLYSANCFLTLTYDDDHLPENGHLVLKHLQDFKKRLRAKFAGVDSVPGVVLKHNQKNPIRTYDCGEYGETTFRPHYHMAVLNFRPYDLVTYSKNKHGHTIYSSKALDKLWGHGFVRVGDLTVESAAYVARYCTKKVNGAMKEQHYRQIDPETGELNWRPQEFATMSRRPGIGVPFFTKYESDFYHGRLHFMNGRGSHLQVKTPRTIESKLAKIHPDLVEQLKAQRIDFLKTMKESFPEEFTPERRAVKAEVFAAQTQHLKRTRDL